MAEAPKALDAAVRNWFSEHGLDVHATHYQFDHHFFAWRFYGEKQSLTLWISLITLEDYAPTTIVHMLKDFDPVSAMQESGHIHLHVASNESEFGAYMRSEFTPRPN